MKEAFQSFEGGSVSLASFNGIVVKDAKRDWCIECLCQTPEASVEDAVKYSQGKLLELDLLAPGCQGTRTGRSTFIWARQRGWTSIDNTITYTISRYWRLTSIRQTDHSYFSCSGTM